MLQLTACSQEPVAPFVHDPAGMLSSDQQERLREFHQLLYVEQDVEFLLVILDQEVTDLDQNSLALFERYRVGAKTVGARGLLLVVDPYTEQARVEVGYDLEGIFPDGFIAGLEYDQMLPFFQMGRVGQGVEALTELLVARLMTRGAAEPEVTTATSHLSGGAGARISTSGPVPQTVPAAVGIYLPQSTPLASLKVYRQVLLEGNKSPELEIYSSDTQQFLRNWLVTDAQQQSALRQLDKVIGSAEELVEGRRAVIRFPVADRQASPYYLLQSGQGWLLDFAEMSRAIGFNHRNQWHFRNLQHQYMFAFADWRFDKQGFPHVRPQPAGSIISEER